MRVDWCVSSWFRIKNTHSHTHAPCWGGVGLRAASAPERVAPRPGHLSLYHHKIASILCASGGRSSRARFMILLMFARQISRLHAEHRARR